MLGRAVAIDREAGGIGPAIRHHRQHAAEQAPEIGLKRRILQEKTDDPAHSDPLPTPEPEREKRRPAKLSMGGKEYSWQE
jgi:hypothetical protein